VSGESPLRIASAALEDARRFFEQQGALGLEGTAMLAGSVGKGITRCVVPDQQGIRSPFGVAVEVTDRGKLQLAGALGLDERWIARIHSHPGEAYHSDTDERNPVLTAEGALSIVVPFFGLGLRRGLSACAIHIYRGGLWLRLEPHAVEALIRVV
jgi:hypothetical protein